MIQNIINIKHKNIFIILFLMFSIIILSGYSLSAESFSGLDRGQYFSNYSDITIEAGKSLIPNGSTELERNLILASLFSSSFLFDQGVRDFVQDNLYFGDNILSRSLYNLGKV